MLHTDYDHNDDADGVDDNDDDDKLCLPTNDMLILQDGVIHFLQAAAHYNHVEIDELNGTYKQ